MPFLNMLASSGTTTTTTLSDWQPVLDALTSQISVSTVIAVIAGAITAGISLVFMWWGVRKLVRTLMGAFRKGNLPV